MAIRPGLLKKISRRIGLWYRYYWQHKANPVSFLRSQGAQIGNNCSLLGGLASFNSAEPYLVRLGDDVTITQGVILVTHDGGTRVFRNNTPAWGKGTVKMGPIDIGNNVFVGVGSIILPNTRIESNVVIGAGSVVTKNVPANVVAAGVPARVLCTIEEYQQRSLANAIVVPDEYLDNRPAYLQQYFGMQEHD